MRGGWVKKTLGEVCLVERGSSPRPIETYLTESSDGVNWVKIGDTKNVDKYIHSTRQKITKAGAEKSRRVDPGDFILSNSMSFGKPYIMATSGYVHDGWFILRLLESIDIDFFHYLLSSDLVQAQFLSLAAGSVVKNISKDLVKRAILPIPPLPEQKRIVAILDEVFEGIDAAIANTEKNLANARELFESYLNGVFTQKGEGWVEKNLGEVCDFLNGFAFKSAEVVKKSDVQLVRMGNLYQNKLNLGRNPVFYPNDFQNIYEKYVLSEGDLIMSLTGTVDKEDYGYTVEVPKTQKKLLLNQRIAKFVNFNSNIVNKKFFLYLLRSKLFLNALYKTSRGVRQANLSSSSMKQIKINLPTVDLQSSLVLNFCVLESETQRLEAIYQRKLEALKELKQSILEKAFTGELTGDVAKEVADTSKEIAA